MLEFHSALGQGILGNTGLLIYLIDRYLILVVNFGEVRRAQLAKSTLHTTTLRPWDLFRSLKVFSDAKEVVGCVKLREAIAPIHP